MTVAHVQEFHLTGNPRHLVDSEEDAPVPVSTPTELEVAILQGRKHIMITNHLDLTAMPLRHTTACLDGCESPLPEISDTETIRVRHDVHTMHTRTRTHQVILTAEHLSPLPF